MASNHGATMDWQYSSSTIDNPLGINEAHSTAPFWNAVPQDHYDLQGTATAPPAMPTSYQNPAPSTTAKRKSKAPTMSAKKWEPCKMRIKELYVDKQKTLKEVRMIVNEEFTLNATERQYKVQIEKWNLERNVKKHDRRVIVKKACYRKQTLGKETGLIRVRGHKVNAEKLERWMREMGIEMGIKMGYDHMTTSPPPDTPSEISFYTTSHPGSPLPLSPSPKLSPAGFLGPLDHRVESSALISSLCRYAHMSDPLLFDQNDAYTLLQGLKVILNYPPSKPCPRPYDLDLNPLDFDSWSSNAATEVQQLDSLVQSAQNSKSDRNLDCPYSSQSPQVFMVPALRWTLATVQRRSLSTHNLKATSWLTPYGRVDALFWLTPRNPKGFAQCISDDRTTDELVAARIAIIPSHVISPFRIEFNFEILKSYSSHCLNTMNVSYKAIVPKNSSVLCIAGYGTVEELKETLINGTASLNDHDPEGRSLLFYALEKTNLEMCKFLLSEGADPNVYEPNRRGFIVPVFDTLPFFHKWEYSDKRARMQSDTAKLLLEAGADFSLPDNSGFSVFSKLLQFVAKVTLETMLNLGGPFISSNMVNDHSGQRPIMPIIFLIWTSVSCDSAEKIVILIKRGADVSFRDEDGYTALHHLFYWPLQFDSNLAKEGWKEYYKYKLRDLIDVAVILITAGSDVYAVNNFGETPTQIANKYWLTQLWIKALEFCGYDSEFVLAHPQGVQRNSGEARRDSNIMTFEEYCRLRTEHGFTFQGWVSEMEANALKRERERRRERDISETDDNETGSAIEFENDTMGNELNWSLVDGVVDIGETELTGGYDGAENGDIAIDFGESQQSLDWAMQWQN